MILYSGMLALLFAGMILLGCEKEDTDHSSFMSVYETTCLKGICALAVVLCHIYAYYNQGIAMKVFNKSAFIPVAMFFLFTGYGLIVSVENKKNYLDGFLINRLGKLYLPLWGSLVINEALRFLLNSKREYSLLTIIRDISGLNAVWFFAVIIVYYLAFFSIWKITEGKGAVNILILFTVLQCIACCLLNMGKQYYTSSFGFVFGMLLAKEKKNNFANLKRRIYTVKENRLFQFLLMTIVAVSAAAYSRYHDAVFIGQFMLRNLLGIVIVSAILFFLYYYKIGNHISETLGRYSYEIYLLHPTVILVVRTGRLCTLPSWCQVAIIFAITIAEAAILHEMCKRFFSLTLKKG